MWHLPLDSATREVLELADSSPLHGLRDATFREYIMQAFEHVDTDQLQQIHTRYLKDLYPAIYLYGPRAMITEELGAKLVLAYELHGPKIFDQAPNLDAMPADEYDYIEYRLALAFRPKGASRPRLTRALSNQIMGIAMRRGDEITDWLTSRINWDVETLIELSLSLDMLPDTPGWAQVITDYNAYVQKWQLT